MISADIMIALRALFPMAIFLIPVAGKEVECQNPSMADDDGV